MKASVIDNFKLLFSDEYKVSDRDYKALSDTLISKGISEDAFENGLISLVKILIDGDIQFPMTLSFLKILWEGEFSQYKFIDMLTKLVKLGYIKLEKVSADSRMNILGRDLKTDVEDTFDVSNNKLLVVNGSDTLDSIVKEFRKFINDQKRINESIMILEATHTYPSYVKDFVNRLTTRYLKEFRINVSVESYVDEGEKESLSLIFSNTSDYTLKDKEIKKLADKYIKKVSIVNDLDTYKESEDELYLGLELTKSKDLKPLLEPVYKFIDDLEVNGVL